MRRGGVLAWAPWIAALIALCTILATGGRPSDDAYITLRYARSIAAGEGFVFNPGEHVLGTTTPLFALALAVLHRLLGTDLVFLAVAGAVSGHLIVILLLWRVAEQCQMPAAGAVATLLYAVAPLVLTPVVNGMETSLFTAATLAALGPWHDRPKGWQAWCAAAAALLRPEGLWTLCLALLRAARQRRLLTFEWFGAGFAVLAWTLFAWSYFGSPLPQSLSAKWSYHETVGAGHAAELFSYMLIALPLSAPMIDISPMNSAAFGALIASAAPAPFVVPRAVVLLFGAAALAVVVRGAWLLWRKNRRIGWLLGFAVGYVVAYCIANPHVFPWYLAPPIPILLLCLVSGGQPARPLARRRFALQRLLAAALLVIAAGQAIRWMRTPASLRAQAYRQAIEIIGTPAQDQSVMIGALEIGAIGFYSRARILDHYGLVSPAVLRIEPSLATQRFRPDYYVVHDVLFALMGLGNTPEFQQHYHLIAGIPVGPPSAGRVQVWQRSGA